MASLQNLLLLYEYYFYNLITIALGFRIKISSYKKTDSKSKNTTKAFIMVSVDYVFDALRALFSLQYFLPDVDLVILEDGSLRRYQKWLIKTLFPQADVLSKAQQIEMIKPLKKYRFLHGFASYGWSGMKFLIPLLFPHTDKAIILDSDTFFVRKPTEINNWIIGDNLPMSRSCRGECKGCFQIGLIKAWVHISYKRGFTL